VRSLRTRLLLAYAGLTLVGFIALALVVGKQISTGTVQDFASGLEEQAQFAAQALKESVEEAGDSPHSQADLSARLVAYADQTGAQVVLLDWNGRFWASSSDRIENTDTPEVNAALSGNRGSDVRGSTAYAAAPIVDEGRVWAVVQLSESLLAAQSLIWRRWLALGGAIAAITIMAGLAAVLLSDTLTRPLERLRQAALQIAKGDFSQRVPESRKDEIGEVARSFSYMAKQVEAMLEEQRAFAGNVSHELRTPLTTIRLRSEALREGGLDDELARQYVVELDDEVQRLSTLVQDLMVLSRLDSGRLEAGREQIDSIRLARQLLAEVKPQAESQSITLSLDAPESVPTVTVASAHLMIVFRNLLNNALKYTPEGGHVSWTIRPGGDAVKHTISDDGLGIAKEDLPYVFDRFYRVDKSRSRAVPGAGLGLSLVRMIVEFYGGAIQLSSEGIGKGTQAYVTWPLPAPTEQVQRLAEENTDSETVKR
jgi:signal transduction histidine kinase